MSQNGWASTGAPPASRISTTASAAVGQRRETKALAPGTRYSSKKAPISSGLVPAALAMCGRPTELASPASAIASSNSTGTPTELRRSTISRARVTRSCWARSHIGRIASMSIQ